MCVCVCVCICVCVCVCVCVCFARSRRDKHQVTWLLRQMEEMGLVEIEGSISNAKTVDGVSYCTCRRGEIVQLIEHGSVWVCGQYCEKEGGGGGLMVVLT